MTKNKTTKPAATAAGEIPLPLNQIPRRSSLAMPPPHHPAYNIRKQALARSQAKETEALQIRIDVYEQFLNTADLLQLPANVLASLVLDAFVELVDEDQGVKLPLMLKFVD